MASKFLIIAALCAAVLISRPDCPASDGEGRGVSGVHASWFAFSERLRRGDYPAAYVLFSEESKSIYSYREFVAEYGPLSRAREMLLGEPASFTVNVQGDWAEVLFTVTTPVSMQERRIAIGMAKRASRWELVAGRNEDRERAEAAARNVLRYLADLRLQPADGSELARALASPPLAGEPILEQYLFKSRQGAIEAIPRDATLRSFHVVATGEVRQGKAGEVPASAARANPPESGPPPPVAAAPAVAPAPVMIDANGRMPELSEPPPPAGSRHVPPDSPGELPELGAPPLLHRPAQRLPERIN